jgi:hypothetical protein
MGNEKLEQITAELFVFADAHPEIPGPAIPLIGTLVENNVPYDKAEQFCAEHFIISDVADYYKQFFDYIVEKQQQQTEAKDEQADGAEIPTLINEIQERLDKLKAILC